MLAFSKNQEISYLWVLLHTMQHQMGLWMYLAELFSRNPIASTINYINAME